jgi:hypothetical protein
LRIQKGVKIENYTIQDDFGNNAEDSAGIIYSVDVKSKGAGQYTKTSAG